VNTLAQYAGDAVAELPSYPDFAESRATAVKRALEVAAAGAKCSHDRARAPANPCLQPASRDTAQLSEAEALEMGNYLGVQRRLRTERWRVRPFARRTTAPPARPGGRRQCSATWEISLAHHGVLFLDELPNRP